MSTVELTPEELFQQCLNELSALFPRLTRFPPAFVALALRVHLEALLQMMLETQLATRQEVREFVRDLEHQTLCEL